MIEHPRGEPGEQIKDRCGYRNGSYERRLMTRGGPIELEARETEKLPSLAAPFRRYQRSEKALVTTLMQMVVQGVITGRVKEITMGPSG